MNIEGIGTDIVDVKRMKSKIKKERFLQKVFTNNEIQYCKSMPRAAEHFAARFAAKESYMKAIGKGWSRHSKFKEIEVVNDDLGAPNIILHGETLDYFERSPFKKILLSISHTKRQALAFLIINK